ncbi:MAG: hypothetical protein GW947_02635 [Candidatus Pacebacteria bacterium]|nr:hypothetical protein [Candidatus Paceibacterota bacterium]
MPSPSASKTFSLQLLEEIYQKKQQEFALKFDKVAPTTPIRDPRPTPEPERDEIFAKLEAAAASLSIMPEKELLYLEQQVSDLLGFEISSSLDGQRLTHSFGKMQALDEFTLQPTQFETVASVRGAAIKRGRPSLGWDKQFLDKNEKQYLLANHLVLLEDWHQKYAHYKNWYKWRKLLLINPFNRIAVVVELASYTLPNPMQFQFGGSPDLIRASQAWSPEAQGLVCVFFIPDAVNSKPGVLKL